ncbi:MAG: class I SAM-dependent methyltransferase [Candidatus Aminicenantes bacterium]|jgi:predicted O-methyltransferase YrrM
MKTLPLKLMPIFFHTALLIVVFVFLSQSVKADGEDLDSRVKRFLDSHDWGWGDMNVPAVDGQTLHDIIIKSNYTRALEIGTSTGHSSIWIAWALSKTGGKLTTIEINERRHREALENFEAAGLSDFIDARLGDAHEIVPSLEGPFDFVFSDADKGWYKNYLIAVLPKLEVGGCYTTHNVSMGRFGRRGGRGWSGDYMEYLLSLPNMETTVDNRGAGLAISYKKSK